MFNTAGGSLYVHLTGPASGKGRRGKWVDAARGEHGDLLDLIRLNQGHDDWRETLDEARAFLCLPRPLALQWAPRWDGGPGAVPERDASEAARRLFRMGRSLTGTPGAAYLAGRGVGYQDVERIWSVLDRVKAKHPTMVLLHGGGPKGAELIAAKWADSRGVPQVAFRPDWTKHNRAAPFRRNDAMLEALPIGVVAFPSGGISDNLADKARAQGIPVQRGVKAGA